MTETAIPLTAETTISFNAIVRVRLTERALGVMRMRYQALERCMYDQARAALDAMRVKDNEFKMPLYTFIALVGGSFSIGQGNEPGRGLVVDGVMTVEPDAFELLMQGYGGSARGA